MTSAAIFIKRGNDRDRLGGFNQRQKMILRDYPDTLLDGRYLPDRIKGIWHRSLAQVRFSKKEALVEFLRQERTVTG
jgi:hypothetical protein